jgi:hypothetical protein
LNCFHTSLIGFQKCLISFQTHLSLSQNRSNDVTSHLIRLKL